ncbi:MAG: AbrB/MazE/SpoVT family DNA-binding domain-containing protein [Candidatus Nanopelagicales bacterium]
MTVTEARITSSGQMSLPAALRRRWGTKSVVMVDKGDYIIVRPLPADIAAALEGSLPPANGLTTAQLRKAARESEGSGRAER